jgi:hypothetical protein
MLPQTQEEEISHGYLSFDGYHRDSQEVIDWNSKNSPSARFGSSKMQGGRSDWLMTDQDMTMIPRGETGGSSKKKKKPKAKSKVVRKKKGSLSATSEVEPAASPRRGTLLRAESAAQAGRRGTLHKSRFFSQTVSVGVEELLRMQPPPPPLGEPHWNDSPVPSPNKGSKKPGSSKKKKKKTKKKTASKAVAAVTSDLSALPTSSPGRPTVLSQAADQQSAAAIARGLLTGSGGAEANGFLNKPLPAPRISWYAKWVNTMLVHYPGHPTVRAEARVRPDHLAEDLQSGLVLVMLVERVVLQPRWQEALRRAKHSKQKHAEFHSRQRGQRVGSTSGGGDGGQANEKREWVGVHNHSGVSPAGAATGVVGVAHKNAQQEMLWYSAQLKPKPQSTKLQLANIELALHMLRKYAPKDVMYRRSSERIVGKRWIPTAEQVHTGSKKHISLLLQGIWYGWAVAEGRSGLQSRLCWADAVLVRYGSPLPHATMKWACRNMSPPQPPRETDTSVSAEAMGQQGGTSTGAESSSMAPSFWGSESASGIFSSLSGIITSPTKRTPYASSSFAHDAGASTSTSKYRNVSKDLLQESGLASPSAGILGADWDDDRAIFYETMGAERSTGGDGDEGEDGEDHESSVGITDGDGSSAWLAAPSSSAPTPMRMESTPAHARARAMQAFWDFSKDGLWLWNILHCFCDGSGDGSRILEESGAGVFDLAGQKVSMDSSTMWLTPTTVVQVEENWREVGALLESLGVADIVSPHMCSFSVGDQGQRSTRAASAASSAYPRTLVPACIDFILLQLALIHRRFCRYTYFAFDAAGDGPFLFFRAPEGPPPSSSPVSSPPTNNLRTSAAANKRVSVDLTYAQQVGDHEVVGGAVAGGSLGRTRPVLSARSAALGLSPAEPVGVNLALANVPVVALALSPSAARHATGVRRSPYADAERKLRNGGVQHVGSFDVGKVQIYLSLDLL